MKICITGHRHLKNPDQVRQDIRYSLQFFLDTNAGIEVVSAIAAGADLLFAEEAINLKIPLSIILPFQMEEYKKDFEGDELSRFNNLINHHKYRVHSTINPANGYAKKQAYLELGQFMVDQSDLLLAVYDPASVGGMGGTGDVIRYGKRKNVELHIINTIQLKKDTKPDKEKAAKSHIREDLEAIHIKKRFRLFWIAGIILGLVAACCLAVRLSFAFSHSILFYLSMTETVSILGSVLFLTVFAVKSRIKFLQKRKNAEDLRLEDRLRSESIQYMGEVQPIIGFGTELKEEEVKKENLSSELSNYKRVIWILAQEQIDYHYQNRIRQFEKHLKKMHLILNILKIIFFTAVITYTTIEIINHFSHSQRADLRTVLSISQFAIIFIPILYGGMEGIKYFGDWKREIFHSKRIIDRLEDFKETLKATDSRSKADKEVSALKLILEKENEEWVYWFTQREMSSGI